MKFSHSSLALFLSGFSILCGLSQPDIAVAQNSTAASVEQRQKQVRELAKDAQLAMQKKDFIKAAELSKQAHQLEPFEGKIAYFAARSYALAGKTDLALEWLETALQSGYLNFKQTRDEADFVNLQSDARWANYLKKLEQTEELNARLWNSKAWETPFRSQLSEDERIAGLSKFWSEVKYNFVFTETLKKLDWDALYLHYLPRVKAATSTAEYYMVLMEMCALLKDGHTNIYPPEQLLETDFAVAPFRSRLIEGKLIVTEIENPELIAQGVTKGVEITRINGIGAKEWAQKNLQPYVSASTPQDLNERVFNFQFLRGKQNEKPILEFHDAQGKTWTLAVPRLSSAKRAEALPSKAPFSWSMLDGNIAYVALNSFGDDTAANDYLKNFAEISKAKAIIFDVRENRGGNSSVGYKVLATLTDQKLVTSRSETRDYKPTYRAWGRTDRNFKFEAWEFPNHSSYHFKGKVVVLTSPRTYSAAEDFAVAFDTMKRGKIIGETSGGSTGQPLEISLPGGGSARICTKKDSYADGKAFVGVGVQAHQVVVPTLADFRLGEDTVLKAALRSLH